jgi:hypothetical protein
VVHIVLDNDIIGVSTYISFALGGDSGTHHDGRVGESQVFLGEIATFHGREEGGGPGHVLP